MKELHKLQQEDTTFEVVLKNEGEEQFAQRISGVQSCICIFVKEGKIGKLAFGKQENIAGIMNAVPETLDEIAEGCGLEKQTKNVCWVQK